MAEFQTPDELMHAADRVREAGYRRFDAYTPMPIHGLAEAMGLGWTPVPMAVAIGALVGGVSGFALCEFMGAIPFVQNIGGRPINSWPAYIPITFEMTVLIASLTAVIGML